MYSLVNAIAVPFGLGKRWQDIDASSVSVATLYQTYRRIQLTLLPAPNATAVFLDMEAIKPTWATYAGTLDDLFTALGNASLPTSAEGMVIVNRKAHYVDVFRAGWTLTPITRGGNANPAIPPDERSDIWLSRTSPQTDYDHVFKHTLVSVNGYYHLTDSISGGVVVQDANKSRRHSNQNQMGMLSFSRMCEIECVPITDAMITQDVPRKATVRLSQDLTNKTVLLVLGGYLHLPNPQVYSRQNLTDYEIDFQGIPFMERFFESREFIDLTSLPLSQSPNNASLVAVEELFSDETLKAYLKLSQSFFVILDTPQIYHQLHLVRKSGTPNIYLSYQEPNGPLVTELGRMPEYWHEYEDRQWSLKIYNGFRENKVFLTQLNAWRTVIDDGNEGSPQANISSAYLMEIGRDV